MTLEQQNFIKDIYNSCTKYGTKYNIICYPAIIAQAINESGWGKSLLASKYHNYFGIKCGTSWNGKSVNMSTKEEYKPGTLTTIKDNFRVYDSVDEGIKGYFDFVNCARYSNLKGVIDPKTYLQNIKNDGYATDSSYVTKCLNIITTNNLMSYELHSSQKSITEIAIEVIEGKWGNGEDRKNNLLNAHYDYDTIQTMVNNMLNPSKSVEQVAREVIQGKWGNLPHRKEALESAGYNYTCVQTIVNNIMKGEKK